MSGHIFGKKYSVMPFLSEKDRLHLEHILICTDKICVFTQPIADEMAFFQNDLIYDATLMNFWFWGKKSLKCPNG